MQTQMQTNLANNFNAAFIENAMPTSLEFSTKQVAFMEQCFENPLQDWRWYVKSGATRCGKTTLDFRWTIPFRIAARKGLKGLVGIGGVTLSSIDRNVLQPMREFWASIGYKHVVSEVKHDTAGNNFVFIFGEKCYLFGMETIKSIKKLRGIEFKYFYGDEVAEWNEEAFTLLKSRLSLPYSTCDLTCNPADENHWFYKFIHSKINIYLQEYTIFDNPFLARTVIVDLCNEYAGTVYYDRYILGKWKRAEGIIYRKFADNKQQFILYSTPALMKINIGVDFGGNGSYHTFVATGFGPGYEYVIHLESDKMDGLCSPNELEERFIEFVRMVSQKYSDVVLRTGLRAYCDSAEQVLIKGLKAAAIKYSLPIEIKNAKKMEIKQRIMLQTKLFGLNRLFMMQSAQTCIIAYSTAVYNSQVGHQDERLDNGTSDIDTLDASEYSIEPEYDALLKMLGNPIRPIYAKQIQAGLRC